MPRVKDKLKSLEVRPKKRFGQNFLKSEELAEAIAEDAGLTSVDTVLEIGVGLGILSKALIKRSADYYAIEIEKGFCEELLAGSAVPAEHVICKDVRKIELAPIVGDKKVVVASNVPYSISTDVILWMIRERRNIKSASLLLQQEFAERLAGKPHTKAYGSLTVLVSLYGKATLGRIVSGGSFHPPTSVSSRMVNIKFYDQPLHELDHQELFEAFVRIAFSMRRKQVVNCLLRHFVLEKDEIKAALRDVGLDEMARAEDLELVNFVDLYQRIRQGKKNTV
ncbi:MAG: ribosomal RNA small subunit methyltransferase A [Deltaproteobacteria bacterium]|nr:ribosomal RNA small subunit methyltransferase A [Deltaproteobacteria bacterium]